MAWFIPLAQGFKIAAGLAQVVFATGVVIRRPVTAVNMAFALAYGANGIAYVIFNLVPPTARTSQSFAVEGRGLFNWIATLAMVLFGVLFLRIGEPPKLKLVIVPACIGLVMLISDMFEARSYHLDPLAAGGVAIYPATAFALALFALLFSVESSEAVRKGNGSRVHPRAFSRRKSRLAR